MLVSRSIICPTTLWLSNWSQRDQSLSEKVLRQLNDGLTNTSSYSLLDLADLYAPIYMSNHARYLPERRVELGISLFLSLDLGSAGFSLVCTIFASSTNHNCNWLLSLSSMYSKFGFSALSNILQHWHSIKHKAENMLHVFLTQYSYKKPKIAVLDMFSVV